MKLDDLVGLRKEKQKAQIAIKACLALSKGIHGYRSHPFPHSIIWGLGGTGKTAFARSIGNELGYHFVEVEAIVFKVRRQLIDFLVEKNSEAMSNGKKLLLFMDELHRLPLPVQESLYIPLEEWRVTTKEGNVTFNPFTFIGATTRLDMLDSNSFISRFQNLWEISRYSEEDIQILVAQNFTKLRLQYSSEVVEAVAQRCLGVPRIAANLTGKIQMTCLAQGANRIDISHVHQTFELEEIDELGLNPVHRRYLKILAGSKSNGAYIPMGVRSISAKMRQPIGVLEGSVEPILFELEFVSPTPRGRIITDSGLEHIQKNL